MTRYVNWKKDNIPPHEIFEDEPMYEDHRKKKDGVKDRIYIVKKTFFFNWDDAILNFFKKIFRKRR